MTALSVVRTSIIPVVASLPSNPYNGQEIYYEADATNGVYWHLIYRALKADGTSDGSSYKWHCVGGSPLYVEVQPVNVETTTSTTYTTLTTAGPSITAPLAGDYDVTIGCASENSNSNTSANMSYQVGAATAVDDDCVLHSNGTNGWAFAAMARPRRKTALSAATALSARYKAPNAGVASFKARWMSVLPVRVG